MTRKRNGGGNALIAFAQSAAQMQSAALHFLASG
jgi:hypothetical protein